MKLIFKVENQKITRIDEKEVVADSKNYLTAKFVFSHEWQNVAKTVVFKNEHGVYNVLLDNDLCKVPHEVIKNPGFKVSVFGGDLITVDTCFVDVKTSGYEKGNIPSEPTPDVYTQIVNLANQAKTLAQSVRDDANSGKFDGKGAKINGYEVLEIKPGNNVNLEIKDGVMTIYTDVVDVSDLVDKVNQKANKSEIPTKTSQLTNDSGFLTQHQDVSNLATKNELNDKADKASVYTKSEIDELVGDIEAVLRSL